MRPEPGTQRCGQQLVPYLALLREGFACATRLSLHARWSLTPPFHPYRRADRNPFGLRSVRRERRPHRRSAFCCTFLPAAYRPRYPSL